MRTITKNVYEATELSPEAKETAYNNFSSVNAKRKKCILPLTVKRCIIAVNLTNKGAL